MSCALAQSSDTAMLVGQVTVNGNPTNGVLVTIGTRSNTTTTYNGQPGYYFVDGVPYGISLPFKASYQGFSYTDSVDPLPTVNKSQYYQLPTVDINATATPVPNATATPTANATATPTANATVSPTPAPGSTNATVTPAPTVKPAQTYVGPATATPVLPSATPAVNASPAIVYVTVTPVPTAVPSPTQTKSPGFGGALAVLCLIGAAYLIFRKGR